MAKTRKIKRKIKNGGTGFSNRKHHIARLMSQGLDLETAKGVAAIPRSKIDEWFS